MTGIPAERTPLLLTITAQLATPEDAAAVTLAADVPVAPEAMHDPGLPVPADKTAVAMFTAHRLDDTLGQLAHATERMRAARAAGPVALGRYHAGHITRHLQNALDSGHYLADNIRAHYPASARELEAVKQTVGLAAAVSGDAKAATTAHLLETTLHELTHGRRHAGQMMRATPDAEWEFNADHAEKHLGGAVEHARKLAEHFADNYPEEARWLAQLHREGDEGEDGKQHARYSGGKPPAAETANGPETISGQVLA